MDKKKVSVLLSFLSITASTLVSSTKHVCASSEGLIAEAAHQAALRAAFGDSLEQRLDLLFIMDRSTSIGQTEFNQTKDLIVELVSFLSARGYILMDEDRTRVGVISFGIQATLEFDAITDADNSIDTCLFVDRLRHLKLMNAATNESNIAMALLAAMELFNASQRDPERYDIKQILWIFFDGAEGIPLPYRGLMPAEWARRIRRRGVKVFSVGVGAWLRISTEREYRVMELATSSEYYACLPTWMKILKQAPYEADERRSIYTEVNDLYETKCGSCPVEFKCVCDVTEKTYECIGNTTNKDTQTRRLSVIVGLCLVGGVTVLALLVVCARTSNRRGASLEPLNAIYEGPPLSLQLSANPNHNARCSANMETVSFSSSLSSEMSSQSGSVIHGIAVQYDINYPQTTIDHGSQSQKANSRLERGQPKWSEYLLDKRNSKNIYRLAIISMTTKHGLRHQDINLQALSRS